tara:strand:- start:351 stop:581 length:231 start_codon:yes stop_codon:yes gene_type:complete
MYLSTYKGVNKMKQLISVLEKICKQLEISNKIASSKLVMETIESDTIKTLTDKQLESITPIANNKINSIHRKVYDN